MRGGPGAVGTRAAARSSPAGRDTPTRAWATRGGRVPTCRATACGPEQRLRHRAGRVCPRGAEVRSESLCKALRRTATRKSRGRSVSSLGNFVWSIADQLRGVYKPHQYGNVILPMTILRRLDCLLAPTRDKVRALAATTDNPNVLAARVR